jgi:MoxR-like ATPase
MPQQVLEICGLINKTTGTYKPKRNFMFRGPSSTGKTSMARAIAAKLGLPYVYITCSADTESSAFLGEPMYDEKGSVKYVESPFIRAIRNGWVVEVQEPYVIQKQGVLTSLNGLLDDGAGVTLATGEFIQRHPDAVVIFTTNVSYVGCKKPNQSVLRRMNNVYDVLLPSEKEIQDRVIANTGFNDNRLLGKMIKCMSKINAHLQEEMLDDGVCGVSELIDWVSTVQVTKDIIGAANSTIISKATDDINEQSAIASIVESQLSNDVYEG